MSIVAYEILKSIVEAEARAVEIKKQAVAQAEDCLLYTSTTPW